MPNIPIAAQSSSSLLDAVLGGQLPPVVSFPGQSSGSGGGGGGSGVGVGAGAGATRIQNAFSPLGSNIPTAGPPSAYAFKRNKGARDTDPSTAGPSGSRAARPGRTPSTRSASASASNTETDSWDLLSDADSRLNGQGQGHDDGLDEGGVADRQVEELQRNVEKR